MDNTNHVTFPVKVPKGFVDSGEVKLIVRKAGRLEFGMFVNAGATNYTMFHGKLMVHESSGAIRTIEPMGSMLPIYKALSLADKVLNTYRI